MSSASPGPAANAVRYVALGDSYTIGTSVGESERFPNQMVLRLGEQIGLALVANLGVNGYSSYDLIDQELPRIDALDPDVVTVLIGVNDVVRGTPTDAYRANLTQIFDFLLDRLPATRIVVVSTPDYTRTPQGAAFGDPFQQRTAIGDFNAIERELAAARGITFVDISGVADQADREPALVAGDGLHPSGMQYGRWVDLIAPVVENLLSQ